MTELKKGMQILNEIQSAQKIERMAWQIIENNDKEVEIVIAGIVSRGFELATILAKKLKEISNKKVILTAISVNKKAPHSSSPAIDCDPKSIKNKVIIVVDDVLNSGRTMLYALEPFLRFPTKSLSIAVLVNRSYRNYPVMAKYVGYSLSTTLHEHIEVEFKKNGKICAYLK